MMMPACGQDNGENTNQPVILVEDPAEQDLGQNDTTEADLPPMVAENPQGNVYLFDPLTDQRQTRVVDLPTPTNREGNLTNGFVNVQNCTEEQGQEITIMGFTAGYLCLESQLARPGADGNYLEITPPDSDLESGDLFAEVMMYYHVNRIHDFFSNSLGVTTMDFPLPAVTNVKLFVTPLAATFIGVQPGWIPFDNAAFIPKESFAQFMLPDRDEGAIIFGQGTSVDFSYDASVIYHEYTHALVSTTRLNGTFRDQYGLNNLPGALNEAVADYFATTLRDDPVLGPYGLGGINDSFTRNLSVTKTCPENLTTAVHSDGEIAGSMLWAMRQAAGKEVFDQILFDSLAAATLDTGFERFTASLLSEVEMQAPDLLDEFTGIAEAHGMIGCDRAKPWGEFQVDRVENPVPLTFPGTRTGGALGFREWVPGYVQFSVDIPEGKAVRLTWTMSGQGGGPAGQLETIVRDESAVEVEFANGAWQHNGDLELNATLTGTSQQFVLDASCAGIDGKAYLMMRNRGEGDVSVTRTRIQVLDDPSSVEGLATCASD